MSARACANPRAAALGRLPRRRLPDGNLAAWKALEVAHQAGKIRAIAVSNFLQADLENRLQDGAVALKAHRSLIEPCGRIIPIKRIERAPEPFGSKLALLTVATYR
ncbi:hypothetical protein GCM10009691_15740 [Brevibacterium picturae]|uniref:Aldo/keto reductase family protein n=1 Tax=Brevibacterium picturae TaxID=260553 RepID=A0ABP4MCS8_9MICO